MTKAILDKSGKVFVIYITPFISKQLTIYLAWKAQIASLIIKKNDILTVFWFKKSNFSLKIWVLKLSFYKTWL